MTAHWESVLTQISEKQCRYQDFMQPLVGTLYQLIDQARSTPVKRFRGMVAPGAGAKKPFKRRKARPDTPGFHPLPMERAGVRHPAAQYKP